MDTIVTNTSNLRQELNQAGPKKQSTFGAGQSERGGVRSHRKHRLTSYGNRQATARGKLNQSDSQPFGTRTSHVPSQEASHSYSLHTLHLQKKKGFLVFKLLSISSIGGRKIPLENNMELSSRWVNSNS